MNANKDVIYRCIGNNFDNGILACGFMPKPTKEQSQINFVIDYYSCFLILSGSGFYYTDDNTKFPIKAGDFVQRFPGKRHSTIITPDGTWLEFFISFGHTTFEYLCSLNLLSPNTPVVKVSYDESNLQRFSRFLTQLKQANENELPLLSLKAQQIILSLLFGKSKVYKSDSVTESMVEACRLLSSQIHKNISLIEVAAAVNMSYENFRKQFRKHTHLAPSQYRIQQKIKHAKLMLMSGVSIKETALLTGYSDPYSFTKQFTHSVGISPGRFIKQNL